MGFNKSDRLPTSPVLRAMGLHPRLMERQRPYTVQHPNNSKTSFRNRKRMSLVESPTVIAKLLAHMQIENKSNNPTDGKVMNLPNFHTQPHDTHLKHGRRKSITVDSFDVIPQHPHHHLNIELPIHHRHDPSGTKIDHFPTPSLFQDKLHKSIISDNHHLPAIVHNKNIHNEKQAESVVPIVTESESVGESKQAAVFDHPKVTEIISSSQHSTTKSSNHIPPLRPTSNNRQKPEAKVIMNSELKPAPPLGRPVSGRKPVSPRSANGRVKPQRNSPPMKQIPSSPLNKRPLKAANAVNSIAYETITRIAAAVQPKPLVFSLQEMDKDSDNSSSVSSFFTNTINDVDNMDNISSLNHGSMLETSLSVIADNGEVFPESESSLLVDNSVFKITKEKQVGDNGAAATMSPLVQSVIIGSQGSEEYLDCSFESISFVLSTSKLNEISVELTSP
eukprot:CAMPEP_0170116788 /NCGR_PEP_ID=MMETSP0020_2-20130122/12525_1 /TAXON_ID=98059 /ORGANISM="Dinobryon sp., Strain UTEXLB2267" /LENGTH=447 /DNA_ID=CAMNT_0010345067 /DNA_START=566 /DNA_END=1909 /DNA_ORIENTATION=-